MDFAVLVLPSSVRMTQTGVTNEEGNCLDLFTRMSGMVLSAELSAAVLLVDVCFDCSELSVEESVVVSVVVERRDVKAINTILYVYRSEGFGASAEGLFGSVRLVSVH